VSVSNGQSKYLTTKQVREITLLGSTTISRMIRDGKLTASVVGEEEGRFRYLIAEEDLLAAMESGALPKPRGKYKQRVLASRSTPKPIVVEAVVPHQAHEQVDVAEALAPETTDAPGVEQSAGKRASVTLDVNGVKVVILVESA